MRCRDPVSVSEGGRKHRRPQVSPLFVCDYSAFSGSWSKTSGRHGVITPSYPSSIHLRRVFLPEVKCHVRNHLGGWHLKAAHRGSRGVNPRRHPLKCYAIPNRVSQKVLEQPDSRETAYTPLYRQFANSFALIWTRGMSKKRELAIHQALGWLYTNQMPLTPQPEARDPLPSSMQSHRAYSYPHQTIALGAASIPEKDSLEFLPCPTSSSQRCTKARQSACLAQEVQDGSDKSR